MLFKMSSVAVSCCCKQGGQDSSESAGVPPCPALARRTLASAAGILPPRFFFEDVTKTGLSYFTRLLAMASGGVRGGRALKRRRNARLLSLQKLLGSARATQVQIKKHTTRERRCTGVVL